MIIFMNNHLNQLKKDITNKYLIAFSIVALISIFAFFTLHNYLKDLDNNAYLINTSGKQRLLSQQIMIEIHHINHRSSKHDILYYDEETSKNLLKSHINDMFKYNEILSTGVLPNNETIIHSPYINNMYFGEFNIKSRVDSYIDTAKQILFTNKNDDISYIVKSIDTQSQELLFDLDKLALQYQVEGETKLQNLQKIEAIALAIIILTMIFTISFLFIPMVKKIIIAQIQKSNAIHDLENLLELKTKNLETATSKLHSISSQDVLTGLRNRSLLDTDIEKLITNYTNHNAPYCVLFLEIDHFNDLQENFGKDMGDKVLIEAANVLLSSVREEDKVYRSGNSKYAILLKRIQYDDSVNFSEKVRFAIEKYAFIINNENIKVTVSCALYHSSIQEIRSVQTVYKLLDIAINTSRTHGKNRVTNVSHQSKRHLA